MNLQEYISVVHDGKQDWFVSECNSYYHQNRINKIIDIKEYLSGVTDKLKWTENNK